MRYGDLLVLLGSLLLAATFAASGFLVATAVTATTGVLAGLRLLSDPVREAIDEDVGLVCAVLLLLHGIAIVEIAELSVIG